MEAANEDSESVMAGDEEVVKGGGWVEPESRPVLDFAQS